MFKKFLSTTIAFSLLISSTSFAKASAEEAEDNIESGPTMDLAEQDIYYRKWHRRFGYLTTALAIGAVATHEEKQEAKESHKVLGMATAASFFTSYYFYSQIPEIEGKVETRSQKYTRWVTYALIPLMIALPIAGIDASKDYEDGKTEADGFGKMKGPLTGLTVGALVAQVALFHMNF